MNNITLYKKHYQIFIKNTEEPLEVSGEWWEILMKILLDKDCPHFVTINWSMYNRFEILKIIPYNPKLTQKELEIIKKSEEIKKAMEEHRKKIEWKN